MAGGRARHAQPHASPRSALGQEARQDIRHEPHTSAWPRAAASTARSRSTSRFDGRRLTGFRGDTLASALLANGVTLVGRSFKYHRPRGIFSAGLEEPNALVTLGEAAGGASRTCRPPRVELVDGLIAESQNRWPSLAFDLQAVNGLFAPFLSAGFYYKTFMGPTRRAWMFYEPFIRRAAGLGRASTEPGSRPLRSPPCLCDVLVVGGGPAGLRRRALPQQPGRGWR